MVVIDYRSSVPLISAFHQCLSSVPLINASHQCLSSVPFISTFQIEKMQALLVLHHVRNSTQSNNQEIRVNKIAADLTVIWLTIFCGLFY
jgi:hypothetical protein